MQVKNLTRKLEKSQSEIEMLKAGRQSAIKQTTTTSAGQQQPSNKKVNSNIYNHSKNAKLVKQYFNLEEILANPDKTRLYIEKLNAQVNDRDATIKNLNAEYEKARQKLNSNITSGIDSDDRTDPTISSSSANKDQLVFQIDVFLLIASIHVL